MKRRTRRIKVEKGAIRVNRKRKKKKIMNIANRHLGMAAITLVVCVLFVYTTGASSRLEERIAEEKEKVEILQQRIEEEEERTLEIEALKEHMLTDEYAEEVAREQLGLVKENEIVFEEAE